MKDHAESNNLLESSQKDFEEHGSLYVQVTKVKDLKKMIKKKEKTLVEVQTSLFGVESALNDARVLLKTVMHVSFDNTLNLVKLICAGLNIPWDKLGAKHKVLKGKLVSLEETLD
ncbi:unnamed protein product [Vicia faba]|uniref:Uncharacterized protein n=1 Tax=Vicia faba TaxID=3906 RepID=A0AAV0YZ62_VICFA|nr:unnamed protein product [Vicia faba]